MPATLAERFVFGTVDPNPATVHEVPRATTAVIGRFAIAAIFLVAGFEKLSDTANTTAHLAAVGLPMPGVLVYVAAFVEILGGLSIALGAFTRLGGLVLGGYLVAVSLVFHAFWNYGGDERGRQLVSFLKNVAIVGGLLMIVAHGPGRTSVDARLRSSLVALAIVLLALAGCRRDSAPDVVTAAVLERNPPPPPADPQRLARGDYVVALAGCKVCHTPIKDGVPDATRAFAGGLEVRMPDGGVWRSPNITADAGTGIGKWSDTQIVTALRRGIRPDGSKLLPIMPYPYYHRMTDADAKAVVTYLRSVRPIESVVERNQLQATAVDLKEPVNNVDPTDDVRAHGEYLANLMHCAACHTPRTGPHANQPFAGGVVLPVSPADSVMSANLTSDPDTGIGQWTEGDIIEAVRTGKTPDNREIVGPMRAYMDGWARLDQTDARALADYIKSVPAVRHEIPEQHTH